MIAAAIPSSSDTSSTTKQQVQTLQSTKSDVFKPIKPASSTKSLPTPTHTLARMKSFEGLGAVDDLEEDSSEDEMAIRGGAQTVVKSHPLLKKTSTIQPKKKVAAVVNQPQAGSRPSMSSDGNLRFRICPPLPRS